MIYIKREKARRAAALLAVIALAGLVAMGCSKSDGGTGGTGGTGTGGGKGQAAGRGPGGGAGVPVCVATVTREDVPVVVSTFGTVEAYATVSVKPQVTGTLSEVHVKEGQDVSTGDLLFVIDPRPYQSVLGAARAGMERDTGQAALARAQFGRTGQLLKDGVATQADYDKDQAALTSALAEINVGKEAVAAAELNLAYCRISSPIDGRVGELLIDRGNAVRANDAALITINQVKPILVTFRLSERELPRVRQYAAAGALDAQVSVPGGENPPSRGTLCFIDNAVASDTGTIMLKAVFDNADGGLWPGQHVNVTLFLTTIPSAVVAPAGAVQDSQSGKYVFVVGPDMTVENRAVVAGEAFGDRTLVKEGLAGGETVVTEGHLKLTPGAAVSVKPPIADAPAPVAPVPAPVPAPVEGARR